MKHKLWKALNIISMLVAVALVTMSIPGLFPAVALTSVAAPTLSGMTIAGFVLGVASVASNEEWVRKNEAMKQAQKETVKQASVELKHEVTPVQTVETTKTTVKTARKSKEKDLEA